jgi:hypothetical protein
MKAHEWQLLTIGDTKDARVVAVCGVCGLIRSSAVPASMGERHVDLRGECPGESQEAEAPEAGKFAQH